jgi:hypothetical protein
MRKGLAERISGEHGEQEGIGRGGTAKRMVG